MQSVEYRHLDLENLQNNLVHSTTTATTTKFQEKKKKDELGTQKLKNKNLKDIITMHGTYLDSGESKL